MANLFEGTELADIGIQIEKNGYEFYQAVAAKVEDEQSKKLFLFLAEEEQEHISAFEKIQVKLETKSEAESYPGEYQEYVKALAAEHVFTKENAGNDQAAKVSDAAGALDLAITFEKDSILFYYEMLNVVAGDGEKAVEALIKQEQSHLKKLSAIKQSLAG